MRISENQKKILKAIGTILLFGTALVAPNVLQLLKPNSPKEKFKYKRTINKLFKDEIIYLYGEKIELTEKGKLLLKQVQVEDIVINDWRNIPEWDGIWHVVSYDIPEQFKKERDYFRRKLIQSNFYQMQLSLWVYPYNCKEEIAVIAQNLGISPFVAYLNTNHLPPQQILLEHFDLHSTTN